MDQQVSVGGNHVIVVDDDKNLLIALRRTLSAAGWTVDCFLSIAEFETRIAPPDPGILLLDMEFPGETGLELQARMTARGDRRPIVFMTGRDEVPLAVQAIRGGALDYLVKPFAEETLLDVVARAIRLEADQQLERTEICALEESFDSLSTREKEVMAHVVAGKMNKQIAGELSLAEITVKVYRSRMMQKMKASSVAALVSLHERLRRR
ncbi:response regulator [Rhizobium sp. BK251]|uniref:response regulator transcription factor n=1 Tax=Rhizobium sp. BK251 TaxID=2512125 RepID=UPI00104B2EB9|nr:response regulator [Rhizobium sp. BK251]TCL63228.1 FixJ family two-component response regulator [Rhizobium sp. BK251]